MNAALKFIRAAISFFALNHNSFEYLYPRHREDEWSPKP
jgi:hypothetical protein